MRVRLLILCALVAVPASGQRIPLAGVGAAIAAGAQYAPETCADNMLGSAPETTSAAAAQTASRLPARTSPAASVPAASNPSVQDTLSKMLRELDAVRSVRWCALKRGLTTVVVGSLEQEKLLTEKLAGAAESGIGTWTDEICLRVASSLAAAGFSAEALNALAATGEEHIRGEALFLRSLLLDRVGRTAEASKGYEMYARGEGMFTDYALLLGARCLRREGYLAAGAKVLERLVQGWESSPVWAEAGLQLCDDYLSLERYESCAGVGELVASKAGRGIDRRSGLHYLGRALEAAGRDAEAAGNYWKIVRDYPSHPKAGEAFRALRVIKSKLKVGLSDEELYRGGVALFKTGGYKEADATLRELISRGRGGEYWRDGVEQAARISYSRRRYTEASENYRLLVGAGGPKADEALLWIGKCEIRAGRYKAAFEILETLGRGQGDASVRAEALWEAGREKESHGLIREAALDYGYAAEHLSRVKPGPEACWRLGFCRYLLGDLEGARAAFVLAGDVAGASYLRAQSLYWLAKTLWLLDMRGEAKRALREAAAEGPGVYYGARAAWILDRGIAEMEGELFSLSGVGPLVAQRDSTGTAESAAPDSIGSDSPVTSAYSEDGPPAKSPLGQDSLHVISDNSMEDCRGAAVHPGMRVFQLSPKAPAGSAPWHFARGLHFLSWGERGRGAREIRRAVEIGIRKTEAVDALHFHDCYIEAMLVAGSPRLGLNSRPSDNDLYASFPLGFADYVWRHSREAGLDPFLAFSIIRQESRFDPYAVSGAGARGLMQLMPSTARKMSRELGLRWRGRSGLHDPEANIRMGTHYFAEMRESLGNLPAALAAYNGGASKAKEWALLAEGRELDAYIEMIGYRETRTYVKLVIMHYLTYLRLYHPDWIRSVPSPASIPPDRPPGQGR